MKVFNTNREAKEFFGDQLVDMSSGKIIVNEDGVPRDEHYNNRLDLRRTILVWVWPAPYYNLVKPLRDRFGRDSFRVFGGCSTGTYSWSMFPDGNIWIFMVEGPYFEGWQKEEELKQIDITAKGLMQCMGGIIENADAIIINSNVMTKEEARKLLAVPYIFMGTKDDYSDIERVR